jgi:hypothetical protein
LEQKSIKRLGVSRRRKGVKVVDISTKKVRKRKRSNKSRTDLFIAM